MSSDGTVLICWGGARANLSESKLFRYLLTYTLLILPHFYLLSSWMGGGGGISSSSVFSSSSKTLSLIIRHMFLRLWFIAWEEMCVFEGADISFCQLLLLCSLFFTAKISFQFHITASSSEKMKLLSMFSKLYSCCLHFNTYPMILLHQLLKSMRWTISRCHLNPLPN